MSASESGSKYYYPGISEQTKSQHHFLIAPISHVHPHSLNISTDNAARRARFEGAWKVIKQELLDYITGEGIPKDAIEW